MRLPRVALVLPASLSLGLSVAGCTDGGTADESADGDTGDGSAADESADGDTGGGASGDGDSTPECSYALNQVRTVLDADLECPTAPHLVLCDSVSGVDVPGGVRVFDVSYRSDGRLLDYEWTVENGQWEYYAQFVYDDDLLTEMVGNPYLSERYYVYDAEGRLERLNFLVDGLVAGSRMYFYDEIDRLIRLEAPDGFHGTTHFEWGDDGQLAAVRSDASGVIQSFEYDAEGRVIKRIVTGSELEEEQGLDLDLEFRYEGGDLVELAPYGVYSYDDVPNDIPLGALPNSAWFVSGAQSEAFIRTGSSERPWRVYLGDHPSGLVEVFQEFHSAHRLSGDYSVSGESITATVQDGNEHRLTFSPPSFCSD